HNMAVESHNMPRGLHNLPIGLHTLPMEFSYKHSINKNLTKDLGFTIFCSEDKVGMGCICEGGEDEKVLPKKYNFTMKFTIKV
ncbi:MAG: hypothetical protein Q8K98_04555, partial [Bacteroidota bacterium]|nr:hypothetical protein [Bacteroidota bacterium]